MRRYKSWAELYAGVGFGQGLSCDLGYIPCSKDALQTICVKPANYEADCPITDVRIFLNENYNAELFKEYTKAEISGSNDLSWGLYYSKNYASLPVSTF